MAAGSSRETKVERRASGRRKTRAGDRIALKRIGITCVCFNLKKASRLVNGYYDAFLAEAGLSSTQFQILGAIGRHENLTISQMADLLLMDRTTLTRNLKPLERMKLVGTVATGDRRKRLVELTPKGWESLMKGIPQWERAQSSIVSRMGDDHRKLLTYLWRFVYGKRYLDA